MATTLTTANMSLVLPVVGAELGPQWATDLNAALQRVDAHDHSSGGGVQITAAGLSITTALSFHGADATALRTTQYNAQTSNPSLAGDVRCLYADASGNLWWNNSAGTQVQLTSGGTLNSGALTANTYAEQSITTNVTISAAASYVSLLVDTTAARTITLPAASAVAAGRFFKLQDISGSSNTNPITLTPAGADTIDGFTGSATLKSNYGSWEVESDGASHWRFRRTGGDVGTLAGPTAAPAVGNVLQASSTSQLTYAPLNLAGGANYVAGVLPAANLGTATGSQTGAVQLNGDLSGAATAPIVVGVTGTASELSIGSANPTDILFGSGDLRVKAAAASLRLGILARTGTGTAASSLVYGQDAYAGAGATAAAGGPTTVRSGASFGAAGGDTNVNGAALLQLGSTNVQMGLVEVVTGRQVVALGGTPATSDLGANTGNVVTWLRTANVVPTAAPTTGTLLYSNAGAFGIYAAGGVPIEVVGTTSASVGVAGGASPLPATPALYVFLKVNGTLLRIPAYN